MSNSPIFNTPVEAYQYAVSQWEAFNAATSSPDLWDWFWSEETSEPGDISKLLRLLPAAERTPVAFGMFFMEASAWPPIEQTVFLGEFLSGPTTLERQLLEAAARGALTCPDNLPLTVDEYPSRIWQRAQATQAPARLVGAACRAVNSMVSLLEGYADFPVPDKEADLIKLQRGESVFFQVSAGELPAALDLVALTPPSFRDLKMRAFERIQADCISGSVQLVKPMLPAISAWISMDDPSEQASLIDGLTMEVGLEQLLQKNDGISRAHIQRLGRFMFRIGQRGLALRCAKAIGRSPSSYGWQHQALANIPHTRIRNAIINMTPAANADAWLHDPAMACSAMSRPLWLNGTIGRVPELSALFAHAADFPWLAPSLCDVFQWHLAISNMHEELLAVEAIAPDSAVGLSIESSPETIPTPP
ncbi:MAG: hypothetical protein WCK77_13195 [Verrucomicrobiota bacterium]